MTTTTIPNAILEQVAIADAHWQPILIKGLQAIQKATPDYLPILANDNYLPTQQRLFAAFQQPLLRIRYVLVGEGPYPREESATGVCFMDGAVKEIWSEKGLSKKVNRATSLRNFIKMLLVADHKLTADNTSGDALAVIAKQAMQSDSGYITSGIELQNHLHQQGFLLLNASLVFRAHVKPAHDAKAWKPFFDVILEALAKIPETTPTFILWGKLAEQLKDFCTHRHLPFAVSEHPYNLSFIQNQTMQLLFQPLHLLQKS